MQQHRLRLHGCHGVHDMGQDFILDLDEVSGLLGDVARGGGDGGHGLTVEQHLIPGQHFVAEVVVPHGGGAIGSWGAWRKRGEVLAADDGHDPGQRCGSARIDAGNPRVGIWATQHLALQRAR